MSLVLSTKLIQIFVTAIRTKAGIKKKKKGAKGTQLFHLYIVKSRTP